jgi:uncharacterized membrane protein YfcA
MTPMILAALAATVAGAAFIQGAIGIGFALIVAPVMGLLAPELLPVCLLLMMLPLNLHVAWRERGAIDRPGARWITLGRFAGTFAGLWILAALSADNLDVLVGASTLVAALAAIAAPPFAPNAWSCVGVGVFTGVTETATGIGGPPLALLYQHRAAPVLRATVALCFLVGEAISLVFLAVAGRFGADHLQAALLLVPAVFAGSAASRLAHHLVGGRMLRMGVLAFAIVTGALLMLR